MLFLWNIGCYWLLYIHNQQQPFYFSFTPLESNTPFPPDLTKPVVFLLFKIKIIIMDYIYSNLSKIYM